MHLVNYLIRDNSLQPFCDSPFVIAVMDITDIAHGKTDDEDKQHFIPFQQWVFWCCHTYYTVNRLNLVLSSHNWAQIMEKNWNRTQVIFAYRVPSHLFQGCNSVFLLLHFEDKYENFLLSGVLAFLKDRLQGHLVIAAAQWGWGVRTIIRSQGS